MLESPEEGRRAEPWAWPHLCLELPLGTCILSQRRPAATGLRGLYWEGWAAEFRGQYLPDWVQLASQEQSSCFISILGVCLF